MHDCMYVCTVVMSRKDIVIYSDIHISICIYRDILERPARANIRAFQAIYEFYFSILIYRDITLSITRHILHCITTYIRRMLKPVKPFHFVSIRHV